ncbi:MAG: M48 family metallopeptidase [Acholeplasmatales bacterium]|jgi:predicted metal-dependent hydrolase|nr:M48 family metallopeptidase [Acholeplasmatales bacterium]
MLTNVFYYIYLEKPYIVRVFVKKSASRCSIVLKDDILTFTEPFILTQKEITDILDEHISSLLLKSNKPKNPFRLWGIVYKIEYINSKDFYYTIENELDLLTVYYNFNRKSKKEALLEVLSDATKKYISLIKGKYIDIFKNYNIRWREPQICYAKTFAGQYTKSTDTLKINLLLALLPKTKLEIVLIHEHVHTIELNHSAAGFHALFEKIIPNHRIYDKKISFDELDFDIE